MHSYKLILTAILLGATDNDNVLVERAVFLPFVPHNETILRFHASPMTSTDEELQLDYPLECVVYDVKNNVFRDVQTESSYRELVAGNQDLDAADEWHRLNVMYQRFEFYPEDYVADSDEALSYQTPAETA
jgi:hypothetical protein